MGDGDVCGSIYLNAAFEEHISELVGKRQYDSGSIKEKDKRNFMINFECGIKRTFSMDRTRNLNVDLPGVKNDVDNGIEDGVITISL